MTWYQEAVFYEVYIRAFADGNGDGIGDFIGLTQKLDYLQELGVTCLWILPMYPSPLIDDGYDIADYYGIHPDYGTLDDFKAFLEAAHARGMRVIADLVMNHTSDQHPWFQSARASRVSPFRDYYVWSDTDQLYKEARIIFIDTQTSNWQWDAQTQQYYWHRFYPQQPDLNYDQPAVRQAIIDVLHYWASLGLDGFRADAVPYLFERPGTNCENLPETHAYLKEVRRALSTRYPDRILLAEANQWPQDVRPYFGDEDEFHMAFHFPVMPRIYMSLAREDYRPIVEIMRATPPIPPSCQWCIFLRNHDELTLEMVTPEEREFMWNTYAPDPRMRLNLGIRRRLAPLMGGDRRKILLLNSILFTLPGSPILYYGDELGMGDNIQLPDRNGVRTPMQWDASPNAGFSSAPVQRLYSPVIDDPIYGYQKVNAAQQRNDPNSLWSAICHLIALRKQHLVLSYGNLTFVEGPNPACLAYYRGLDEQRILALHNLSGGTQTFTGTWDGLQKTILRDLVTGIEFPVSQDGGLNLQLQPYQFLWLSASL